MTRTSTKQILSTSFGVVCYALLIFVVFPFVVVSSVLSGQGEIKSRKERWTYEGCGEQQEAKGKETERQSLLLQKNDEIIRISCIVTLTRFCSELSH